jgi:hypothetical protein
MRRQSEPRLNEIKNVDLTGQGDTTNLQSSIINLAQVLSAKNLIIPEAVMFLKG